MLEIILAMALTALTVHVLILQQHYTRKFSELSVLINNLLDLVDDTKLSQTYLDEIRLKIFNSSQ
ncbi:hypothetical protein SDC9_06038 [bioreactor metagenome]|uniref:Uncharacterized protein n=1 Tax=bioreactor metagenome TaxID=1076179 RepID=A0A644T1W2_9ZZZZ|nr:hypothetical protein [Negativicutes bacterium]